MPTDAPDAPLFFELTFFRSADGVIVPFEFTIRLHVAVTVPVNVTGPVTAKAGVAEIVNTATMNAIFFTSLFPNNDRET